ncbi:phosphatidylglycerophosphatase and protein-tyrosine phosphatase 1 isoform X2 [Tamandua tetradactyla]|uniref:phosphatidylglycerophosphatase and protein-tyrosine phosphatase 1 isoform X2 n=1 Tax=Tamandua tetradactyla TaxID=48850 RepID=UPI00405473A3
MAAAALLEAGVARLLFYPTLLYTLFRGKLPGRGRRDWYHRIDATVLLGALPLRSMTRRVGRAGPGSGARPGDPADPEPCPRAARVRPPGLSPPFASAAGAGRERARGGHHERGVRDEVPVQLLHGEQLEPGGGRKSHHQDPVPHPRQTWPVGSSQRVLQDYSRASK